MVFCFGGASYGYEQTQFVRWSDSKGTIAFADREIPSTNDVPQGPGALGRSESAGYPICYKK